MDTDQLLQYLRDHALEEGRAYIQEHLEALSDHKATGELLAEEALRVLYAPLLSLKIAELLISYGEITGDIFSHALGLKAKGDALQQIGHYQAAIEALDASGQEFLQSGDDGNWARSRISWILAAGWLGRVEEALKAGELAREVFLRLSEPYWVCVIDSNIAILLGNIGKNEEAVRLYERMLTIYPTITNQSETFIRRSIALAQLNLGYYLSWLGEFQRSYRLQQGALETLNILGETSLAVTTEVNLADLDYTQGYYGSALRRYYQARERLLQSDEDNTLLLAGLKMSMANCLVKLDRLQEASLVSQEAVEVYRKAGISQSVINALHQHAITLVATGKLKEALTILDEVWNLFKEGGFELFAYLAKLQQAEILLELNSAPAAYDLAQQVKYYFDAQSFIALSARASLVMASASVAKAQQVSVENRELSEHILAEALDLCKETLSLARRHDLQEEVYKSYYLMGRIFALQNNLAKTARYYHMAIAQIERMLNNLVHDLSPSFLHTTWAIYEEMVMLCLQKEWSEKAFAYLERARSITLRRYLSKTKQSSHEEEATSVEMLRMQMELQNWQESHRKYSTLLAEIDTSVSTALDLTIIERELKQCEANVNELFERLHLHQVDVDRKDHEAPSRKHRKTKERLRSAHESDPILIRQHLSPGELLLTYYLHEEKFVIFAMTKDEMVTYKIDSGTEQVEYLLPLLHAHLQTSGWPDPRNPPQKTIRRLLNRLYDLLIAPVTSLLPPALGHITIIPYGSLHTLPFHALHDGMHFLVERFQVSYLPASSLLMYIDNGSSEGREHFLNEHAGEKPPLVFGYSERGLLQRVREEAKTITEMINGNCFLDDDASIARLIKEAPGSPIIHLATHGKSRLDAPNFSYVRLSDGQLNAIDAFSLDLKECELVTLSGCETGLALSSGGDEQLGLGRAFLAAGATSLIMSLWPVEDNATNELMIRFYQNLLKGASKVQALRRAQCDLLQSEAPYLAHPYFWAAFRLVGDPGPLRYRAL